MTDQPTESIEFDIPDDLSDMPEADPPKPYRTLLEIWRAVLEPAVKREMVERPISPQWATKIVETYPEIRFADTQIIHERVFEKAANLAELLETEIATDDECLKRASAEEDARENAEHYRNMLFFWQAAFIVDELEWRPTNERAAIDLAVLSEVQQMFLGPNGLISHLDSIGFQYTDADQEELQKRLVAVRDEHLGEGGEDE